MWRLIFPFVLIVCIFSFQACVYDNEEELLLTGSCDSSEPSYSGDILPLIRTNCYRCHDAANNFGDVTLEGYDQLKIFAENGKLLGVIKRQPGFFPMPQDAGKLDDCIIEKIENWVTNGAPNN